MKYIITAKNILDNLTTTNPETRTELCTELVMTRIKALQLLKNGTISSDDTIVTRIDRKCLYENIFKNIIDWDEFASISQNIDKENIIDIPILIDDLCGVRGDNQHKLVYDNLGISNEEIFNIKLEKNLNIDVSKPYICLIIRRKQNMTFLHYPDDFWNDFINKILETTNNKLNIFVFGEFIENKIAHKNVTYINKLQDWCSVLENKNCKLLVSSVCGAINPIFFTGHENSNLLLIDNLKYCEKYPNNPSFYGDCINFKKVKIKKLEFQPTVEELVNETMSYIKFNPKILLFGGSGFLGNVFLRENPDIISVGRTKPDGDLSNVHIDLPSMDDLSVLDDVEFDSVIFLIGNSNHHQINNSCLDGIEYNVIPLKKALYYMQNRNLNKFVCFSSILLYGDDPKDRPVNEEDKIFPYQNEYIFSKYLAEQIVEFYKEKVPIINIRLCNIYGDTTLVRPDLIPTLIHDAITKESPSVWNSKPKRDFIFTSDAVDAILKLIQTEYTGNLNLGSGTLSSIQEVLDIIGDLSGKKITSLDKDVSGVMKFVSDTTLIKKLINWEPKYTLKEGLEKSYKIMKNNIESKK